MNDALFTLGNVPVTPFGAGMALALLVFLAAAYLACARQKTGYGVFIRYAVLALPLCFILSRLVFVLANITYYCVTLSNPALALRFWDGGYSMTGALAGLLLAAFLAGKWTRQSCGKLLDAAAWAALPALCVERLFESFTTMGLGRPFTYEWMQFLGVDDGYGELVHPVYRYEIAAALIILLAVSLWLLRRKQPVKPGDACLVILTLLGSTQVIMESLRADGHMIVFHFVRVQQVLSLACAVVILGIFARRLHKLGGIKKSQQLLLWLVVAVCIGLGIFMEFRVDRGSLKMLYYAVLTLCMGTIAALALALRCKAEKLR